MERSDRDILSLTAGDVMTRGPVSIPPATLAAEALNIMEQRKITSIVVVDGDRAASRASCTCTTSGGRSWSDDVDRRRSMSLQSKAAAIQLLLFDVDGVLTDGRVHRPRRRHREQDVRHPRRHRDGLGAARAASRSGLLSARYSPTTPHRAAQLGITLVHQGVSSKLEAYERILADRASDRRGRRLHGRRHRRSGGAGARRACRRRRPMPWPKCDRASTGSAAATAATARRASWSS